MTADGRYKQNLFCLLKAPQILYIDLKTQITYHAVDLEKSTAQYNACLV